MQQRTVAFPSDDPLVVQVARELVDPKIEPIRRPRNFPSRLEVDLWKTVGGSPKVEEIKGTIVYGEDKEFSVEVIAYIGPQDKLPETDWAVKNMVIENKKLFTSSPRRTAQHVDRLPKAKRHLVMYADQKRWAQNKVETRFESVPHRVANQLAAEISSQAAFRPQILSFSEREGGRHAATAIDWIVQEKPLSLISACCLHADEGKTGIVDHLDPDLTNLLIRTAQAAFAEIPSIDSWRITAFGPKDYQWLGDLGITKVLLPYMWDAPAGVVCADLARNLEMTEQLVEKLDKVLSFPVTLHQISEMMPGADVDYLVKSSRDRAEVMLPGMLAQPPEIFSQLKNDQDKLDRIQQEAFLYLADTIQWGQLKGEDRPKVLYVALEVHGGYWSQGNLYEGPNGEFLPLAWFPQCIRQHWGPWAAKRRTLQLQRQKLDSLLRYLGV